MNVLITVYVFVMAVLCCIPGGPVAALQRGWRKRASALNSKKSYKQLNTRLEALARAIEDAELHKIIKEMTESTLMGPLGELFTECNLDIIECTGEVPTELRLHGIKNGTVHFAYLPDTLRSVTVESSTLNQELDIESLPKSITSLVFSNVTFLSGTAKVHVKSATLQNFTCRHCGLHSISFSGESGLQELDLSGNALTTVPSSIPNTVVTLIMQNCSMNMPLEEVVKSMPRKVLTLDISYSSFTGVLEGIRRIPPDVRSIKVTGCRINSDVSLLINALKHEKRSMENVVAQNCGLTGKLSHGYELGSLLSLDLAQNRISSVVWSELPSCLEILDLSTNALDGILPVGLLPPSLKVLNVSQNGLTGTLDVAELPPRMIALDVGSNRFSGNIDFTRLPESILQVHVQHNRFQGTPNLVEIPVGIQKILIYDNNWDSLLPSF